MVKVTKQTHLVMDAKERKIQEALEIISAVDIPLGGLTDTRKARMALALLAVANIKPDGGWDDAEYWKEGGSWAPTTRDIIEFCNEHYGTNISSGSYDDVRRRDLLRLVQSGFVLSSAGKPNASPNDPTRGYAIPKESIDVLTSFGTSDWKSAVKNF